MTPVKSAAGAELKCGRMDHFLSPPLPLIPPLSPSLPPSLFIAVPIHNTVAASQSDAADTLAAAEVLHVEEVLPPVDGFGLFPCPTEGAVVKSSVTGRVVTSGTFYFHPISGRVTFFWWSKSQIPRTELNAN